MTLEANATSTVAESQPVEGASKLATLKGKGLTDYARFFHVYEGAQQNGQSAQNGECTGDSGNASAGLGRAAYRAAHRRYCHILWTAMNPAPGSLPFAPDHG